MTLAQMEDGLIIQLKSEATSLKYREVLPKTLFFPPDEDGEEVKQDDRMEAANQ